MKSRPYTIYVKHRPLRTGFLINTDVFVPGSDRFEELVDEVIGFSHKTWAGRTNPIVFFSGDSFSAENWKLLQAVDVDYVKSFSPVPDALVRQLDERLQPWGIDVTDFSKADSHIHIESYGIVVPPTPENLRPFGDAKFLMFDFAPDCAPLIRRFIHRNFGTYYQWIDPQKKTVRREMWLELLLPKLNVEHISLSDSKSLAEALTLMVGTPPGANYRAPLRFVTPNELSSLYLGEILPLYHISYVYQVITGNGLDDLAEYWNGVFWKMTRAKPYAHQLWLPPELGRDPSLRESLRNWLRYYTHTGNSDAKEAEFVSKSLEPTELEALRSEICNPTDMWRPRSHVVQPEAVAARMRDAEEQSSTRTTVVLSNTGDATRYSGNNDQETFSLTKPDVLSDDINPNGLWMVDVQIEQFSPHRPTTPEQSWWIVPRRNSGGLLLQIFREAARVNRYGLFSVRVENQSSRYVRRVKPELKIHLPSESKVVPLLIMHPAYRPLFTVDARHKKQQPSPISHVRFSDKGEYLNGLIRVFGNFWTAKEFCDRRFWRQMFAKLANRDARKDATLKLDIANLLTKRAGANDSPEYLADRVLNLVRGQRAGGIALPYSEFKRELDELAKAPAPTELRYPQGDTIVIDQTAEHLTEEEMRAGLNDLVALNVLRPGLYVRCSFCGIKTWYHVDDLKQQVRCPGCGHERAIETQQEWCYALNSLAEMSVVQGQLAVMQALAALASNHHEAFFFSPNLELFRAGNSDPWHEIDVPAVVDGEFIIGEVKEGERPISKRDFDELAEIAELLRPQRAIMFMSLEQVTENNIKLLNDARQRLSPQGIKAQIFALPTF